MIDNVHLLKQYRTKSPLLKQEVAALLNINASNLTRYESGSRNPTPEIILTYHILFGASLQELFKPLYARIAKTIEDRSLKLITQLEVEQSPKRQYKLSFLTEIVNRLNNNKYYASRN